MRSTSSTELPVDDAAYCGYSGNTTIRSTAAARNRCIAASIDGEP
jgi:hypothetical protein